jgi:hypothetical protein
MQALRWRIEKSEIDEAEIQAFRRRVGCAGRLAKSDRLIASFERGRPLQILAEERASSVIAIDNLSGESTDRRNCISLGIKLELAESPV